MRVVPGAEPRRDETLERLADGFGSAAAEHVFRGSVEQDDALPGIDGNDGVHRRLDNGLEPGLVAEQTRRAGRNDQRDAERDDRAAEPPDRSTPRIHH